MVFFSMFYKKSRMCEFEKLIDCKFVIIVNKSEIKLLVWCLRNIDHHGKYFSFWSNNYFFPLLIHIHTGIRGGDRMVVGFTTTYAVSAYHHWCCEFESRSGRGVHHYVIKFVSDLEQVGGVHWVLQFPPPIKLTATI